MKWVALLVGFRVANHAVQMDASTPVLQASQIPAVRIGID